MPEKAEQSSPLSILQGINEHQETAFLNLFWWLENRK